MDKCDRNINKIVLLKSEAKNYCTLGKIKSVYLDFANLLIGYSPYSTIISSSIRSKCFLFKVAKGIL